MGARWRVTLVLLTFVVLFAALELSSFPQKSATIDESLHLTAGYAMLRDGDYRLDLEHPPLVRLWAAVPLRAMRKLWWQPFSGGHSAWEQRDLAREFLFVHNDADSLLMRARLMIVLLGIGLGVLVFCWGYQVFGFATGTVLLAMSCLEPNLLAHAGLVTTDLGVTCFAFGTVYFLWRAVRDWSVMNVAGVALFFAAAQVTKFSVLLLAPLVVALVGVAVWRKQLSVKRAVLVLTLSAATGWLFVWAAYGFRYAPSADPTDLIRLESRPYVSERLPRLSELVGWADRARLVPNAYAQGLLICVAKAQRRPMFLAGELSGDGWWYYFPVAFLLKTPVALLVLLVAGLRQLGRGAPGFWEFDVWVVAALAVFLGAGVSSRLNIGLRHVLPMYPFVLLIAGRSVSELWQHRQRWLLTIIGLAWAAELAVAAPHYLAFFNTIAGGPRNGHKLLADSNIDWGQDLKLLKRWMDQHGVEKLNLSYFGTADPAYYGIHARYLPGSPSFIHEVQPYPQLPGYVAVSVQNLLGVTAEDWAEFYRPLLARRPVAVIGYSIHVYWVEQPWW
jgi:hypothetical protein